MQKKHLLTAWILVLALLLTACGASTGSMAKEETAEAYDMVTEETVVEESLSYDDGGELSFNTTAMAPEEPKEKAETEEQSGEAAAEQAKAYAEKIIYSGNAYIETTDFDASVSALEAAVESYGGFVQDSNVSGRSNGDRTAVVDRYAYYVVRIPTKHFNDFMAMTGQIGNVTSSGRSAENVTSQYTDYEARLSSLYTQEERLMTMLGTSGDLESLIALEQRLAEVRYEIESIERNLRNLDQRLAYSTVNIDMHEVEVYTQTTAVQRSFGEKLSDSFRDGWEGFGDGCQNLVIWLAGALPTLILLALIGVGAYFLISRKIFHKGKKAKKENASEETTEE